MFFIPFCQPSHLSGLRNDYTCAHHFAFNLQTMLGGTPHLWDLTCRVVHKPSAQLLYLGCFVEKRLGLMVAPFTDTGWLEPTTCFAHSENTDLLSS